MQEMSDVDMTGLQEEVDPTTAGAGVPHGLVVGAGCRPLFDAVSDIAALGKSSCWLFVGTIISRY
ncbi:unnamed protein product [Ectocarpus sp. 6 AP-2014]